MDSKVVCFFGSMGRQFDLETVIEAARMLEKEACPIRFVLCGSGNSLAKYQELAKDCASIVLPGRVGFADIWTLMRMSYLAIAPYLSTDSFRMSVPNKAIEYMSAGLPIVSSLSGVLEELLRSSRCGITYANGDSISLKNCLLHLCENAEEVEIMSKNALQVFEEKYVAETVYGEMIEHLESIAQTSSAILEAKPIRVS